MGFVKFMVNTSGRIARIIAGIALILVGLLLVQGIGGIVLAVVGLVPLLAGLFDVCVFAPLFKMSFMGKSVRQN
jgi:hypothetical protein